MAEWHLSPAELEAWRDRREGDQARIVGHLAACATCRHAAADLERERPIAPDALPSRFDAADFAAVGRRAGGARAPVVGLPRRTAYLAAAATLVLAALVVPQWWPQGQDESSTRGAEAVVTPVAPVDTDVAIDAFTFEWTAATTAGPLRLVVMALDEPAPLVDRDVSGTRYAPTPDERRRFAAGREYHWFVEYRGAGAGPGTSASARFRVR
jgi:hypothetical protein